MYLAEADTGRVIRKIVSTAGDPHFDSLQFLASAGSWAPDNRRVVFSALRRGRPVLTIVDVETGRTEHERAFPELGEIFNPAWSPDGTQIVFSALTGGLLDLHLHDLVAGTVRQLTRDPFAEMHPSWSPDGQEIAFITDRFNSDFESLAFGEYRIAVLNVATGETRPIEAFDVGRHARPQWSADGRALYFVAAPDGIANVYSMETSAGWSTRAEPGIIARVTNLRTGVSGITPLTPALSVASAAPRLVVTVFEGHHYNIYRVETAAATTGTRDVPERARDGARLPPVQRATGDVEGYLATPSAGLPQPTEYEPTRYRPRLSLDAVGQPTVGVGIDRFGAYAAGGISMLFSDMLGDHTVGGDRPAHQPARGGWRRRRLHQQRSRWNWGVIGEQTPYVAGSFAQGLGVIDGQPVFVQQEYRVVQRTGQPQACCSIPSTAPSASSCPAAFATSASASGSRRGCIRRSRGGCWTSAASSSRVQTR
jgi:dipeptidyl aminopeptidase/acylaminoacyl peptidase